MMDYEFMIDFGGEAWVIIGPWIEVYGGEIGFESQTQYDRSFYLTFYEAAWAGFIEKYMPMGEGI